MALLTGALMPCDRHCSTLSPRGPSSCSRGVGSVCWLETELPLLELGAAAGLGALRWQTRGWYSSSSELLISTSVTVTPCSNSDSYPLLKL